MYIDFSVLYRYMYNYVNLRLQWITCRICIAYIKYKSFCSKLFHALRFSDLHVHCNNCFDLWLELNFLSLNVQEQCMVGLSYCLLSMDVMCRLSCPLYFVNFSQFVLVQIWVDIYINTIKNVFTRDLYTYTIYACF